MVRTQEQRSADADAARQRAVKAHARGERNLGKIASAAGRSESQTSLYLSDAGLSCNDPVDAAPANALLADADVVVNLSYTEEPAGYPLVAPAMAPLRADGRYSQSTVSTALRRLNEDIAEDAMEMLEEQMYEVADRARRQVAREHPEVDGEGDVGDRVTLWLERTEDWLLINARAVANSSSVIPLSPAAEEMRTPWVHNDDQSATVLYRHLHSAGLIIGEAVADELERAFNSSETSEYLEDQCVRVATTLDEEIEAALADAYERELDDLIGYVPQYIYVTIDSEQDEYKGGYVEYANKYNNFFNYIAEKTAQRIEQGYNP